MAKKKPVSNSKKKAKKPAKKVKSSPPKAAAPSVEYRASLCSPRERPLDPDFAKACLDVESQLGCPVVLLWQGGDSLSFEIQQRFLSGMDKLPAGNKVAVLVYSPGGQASVAYRLSRLIRNRCGGYMVVVPRWAKSAATLFSLGAEKIILGQYGELGPLDAQIADYEREEQRSALEVVQAIERLNQEAMTAMDQQMIFWMGRSGKKIDTLLPVAAHFVAEMMAPMFDKIDAVDFTKHARILKVAQDYAVRLLRRRMDVEDAEKIASALTKNYSDHGFVIDTAEARSLGLAAEHPPDKLSKTLNRLALDYSNVNAYGTITKVQQT